MVYVNEINYRVYPELGAKTTEDTTNNPGAGIKFYGRVWGWLLSTCGFAKQVTVLGPDNEELTLYVNARSLAKYALRIMAREDHKEAGTQALQKWYSEVNNKYNPYFTDNIVSIVNTSPLLDLETILARAHKLANVLKIF